MSDSKITISPRVARIIYFRFRDLCHAHGLTVQRGVEEVMRRALERARIPLDLQREAEGKEMHRVAMPGAHKEVRAG